MEKMRNFLQSWTGKAVLILTLIPMAFLGVQGTFGGASIQPDEMIKVGEQVVDVTTFQQEVNAARNELLQQADASMINEAALTQDILRNMVSRALLEHQAKALGMTVSDDTITRLLQQDASFHDENGQFSNDVFAQFLQQRGMTKDMLFQNFRTQLSLLQLNGGILGTALYPVSHISHLLDLQLEAREVWVHRLKWQDYVDQVNISDSEIQAYFNENQATLIKPATVDLSYIELHPDLMKTDMPTEDEIAAQYTLYLQENGFSDGRQLAQILLTGADAAQKAAAVRAKIDAGESFEKLAATESDDPSGKTGGNIGTFNASVFGDSAQAVEKALNGLAVGQVSQPVQTSFGYHLFKVTGMDNSAPSAESVRDELINRAAAYKRKAAYAEMIARINGMANDGMGVADIAREASLSVQTITSYPQKDNQTALPQPAVIAAAFDEFTIQDQGVSSDITLADKTAWIQPANFQAERPLTLAEATPMIRERLAKQQATELALADAKKMVENAQQNGVGALTTPSAHLGISTRANPKLLAQESASLFLNEASDGHAVWSVQTDEGATVMIGGVIEKASEAQLAPADRLRAANMIKDNVGQDNLEDYLQYLRDTQEVIINEAALNNPS